MKLGARPKLVVSIIVTALTIIPGLVALYNTLSEPGASVEAEMRCNAFTIPPGFVDSVVVFATNQPTDELDTYRVQNRIRANYGYLSGYWTGSIRNDGDRSATNVSLQISDATFACIGREVGTECNRVVGGVIRIGDLLPRESVTLNVWANYVDPDQAGYFESKMRLSYNEGVGKIHVVRRVGRAYEWLSENLVWILYWLFIITLIAYFWINYWAHGHLTVDNTNK